LKPRKTQFILGLKPKARISVVPMALANGIAMTDVITSGFILRKAMTDDITSGFILRRHKQ
jgi:hypothetical protein